MTSKEIVTKIGINKLKEIKKGLENKDLKYVEFLSESTLEEILKDINKWIKDVEGE